MTIYTRNTEGVLTPLKLPVIKGKDGKDGKNGVTPNITLGEVNTMESGEEVNVIIKGDKENPILDFNLPKGEEGLNIALSSDKIDRKLKRIDSRVKEIETKNEEQEERIKEVENKEKKQNFYINGLFNENEDGRVSIEEEGNDIKLESSRKGFVEVDKIVGNTLVDRVSEPMRELTLNGDIDTQGTFVTTTEGVENGLVDIVCEGNTLVNHLGWVTRTDGTTEVSSITLDNENHIATFNKGEITADKLAIRFTDSIAQPSKTYTLVFNIKKNTLYRQDTIDDVGKFNIINYNGGNYHLKANEVGLVKVKLTQLDISTSLPYLEIFKEVLGELIIEKPYLLEGDWTQKEISKYFEGMKSVGEQADGSHKIEVLSKNGNENLFKNVSKFYDSGMNNVTYDKEKCAFTIDNPQAQKNIRFEKVINKDGIYTLSFKARSNSLCRLNIDLVDKGATIIEINDIEKEYVITFDTDGIVAYDPKTYHFIDFAALETTNNRIDITEVKLEEGSIKTPFTQTSNKKEISLNEPLRGLPNGVKDRFVKIDGKWFIERNCYQLILDGSQKKWNRGGWTNTDRLELYLSQLEFMNVKGVDCMICDKMKVTAHSSAIPSDYIDCVTMGAGTVSVFINISKLDSYSQTTLVGKGKAYLQDNPIKLVYQLAKPIYEPLEIAPELSCYDEMTHISNNSIIPCNMVVKNTGFSCRALTSGGTYTVVHNGDKGVTAKVDIIDNMVRLSGKCKTVSDVTVVDGNVSKLHYTFKGMKSTFEDKLVTQEMVDNGLEKAENLGKYRVDVTVRGKNIFDGKLELGTISTETGALVNVTNEVRCKNYIKIPKYKNLVITAIDFNKFIGVRYYDYNFEYLGYEGVKDKQNLTIPEDAVYFKIKAITTDLSLKIQIEEGRVSTPYEPYFECSETVYLNSPFYKGDEIVWKEDGLYHYHKMETHTVDPSFIYSVVTFNSSKYRWTVWRDKKIAMLKENPLRILPINNQYPTTTASGTWGHNGYKEGVCQNSAGHDLMLYLEKYNDGSDNSKRLLQKELTLNPLTIVYMLAEPYYEKISDNNILLDVPNNATLHIDSTIPCQNTKVNYTSRIPSLLTMEDDISNINKCSIDMIANNFDMDYRLLEVEWALEDIGINLVDTRRINNTGLSRFHQAKLLITSGEYDKEKLTCQLSEYLERRYLDQEEFNELIDLMD